MLGGDGIIAADEACCGGVGGGPCGGASRGLTATGGVSTPAAAGIAMAGDILPPVGLSVIVVDALAAKGLTVTAGVLTFPCTGELVRGTITGLDTTTGPGMTKAGLVMPRVRVTAASVGLGGGDAAGDLVAPGVVQVILKLRGHFSCIASPAA